MDGLNSGVTILNIRNMLVRSLPANKKKRVIHVCSHTRLRYRVQAFGLVIYERLTGSNRR
jgi:hypothetical protein